jgi:uncharacterized protein
MKNNLVKKSISLGQSLIIVLSLNLINVMPSFAQEMILRTLTVTGQGQYVIPTSITKIQLGVEIQGETAQQVQAEVAKRSSDVMSFLRSQNVSKLQTTGISLQPQYNYDDGNRRLIGYVGTNTFSFEIGTQNAGVLLDRSVEAGATRIDQISFTATDEEIVQAQNQALRQASLDAQRQAQAVLSSLDLTQQEIVGIQVNHAAPPIMPKIASFSRAESYDTPVEGGDQTVTSSVTLQIRY